MLRGGWEQYEHLFQYHTDEKIAELAGKTVDAVRLKRIRLANQPSTTAQASYAVTVQSAEGFVGMQTAFFDLETTNLNGMMGRILAACSVDQFGIMTTLRGDKFPTTSEIDDRLLAVTIRDILEEQDVIVGWNSKLFDVPMLNARLMRWGERPLRKDLKHIDLMYYARGQFMRIGSSKLDNVQKFFRSPNSKTPLDWDTWSLAGAGNKEALDRVVEHCEADCLVLRDVFAHLKQHITIVHR